MSLKSEDQWYALRKFKQIETESYNHTHVAVNTAGNTILMATVSLTCIAGEKLRGTLLQVLHLVHELV